MSGYGKSNPGPCWQLVDNLSTTYAHVSDWANICLQHQFAIKPLFKRKTNKQKPESHSMSFFSTFIGSSWWSSWAAILRALERVDWPHLSSWQEDFYISCTWTLLCSGRSPGPAFQIRPFFHYDAFITLKEAQTRSCCFIVHKYSKRCCTVLNMKTCCMSWSCGYARRKYNSCMQWGILTLILLQEIKQEEKNHSLSVWVCLL